jgi:hypothetical protein
MNEYYIPGWVSQHSGDNLDAVSPDDGSRQGILYLYPPPTSKDPCKKISYILTNTGETIALSILNSELIENIRQQILEPWVTQNYSNNLTSLSYLINGFNIGKEELVKILAQDKALIQELNSITTKHLNILESQNTSFPKNFSKACVNDFDHLIDAISQKSSKQLKNQLSLLKLSLPQLENKTLQQFLNQASLDNKLLSKLNYEIEKFQTPKIESITITNYPNPSNSETVLSYSLPEATYLIIKIRDIQGKELQVVEKSTKNAGNYEIGLNTSQMPNGVYICTLETLKEKTIRKIIVKH